jgi:hypothetical protein
MNLTSGTKLPSLKSKMRETGRDGEANLPLCLGPGPKDVGIG